MWIRSQDKTKLLKVEDVRILDYSDSYSNIWANNNCNLGKYSTKEKALKVMDIIQTRIIQNETIYAHGFSGSGVRDYNIFQMPADEEV